VEDESAGGLAFLRALAKRRRFRDADAESGWGAPADSGCDAERARRRVGKDAVSIPRYCGLRGLDGACAGPGGPAVTGRRPGPRRTISRVRLQQWRSTIDRSGSGTARLGDYECGASVLRGGNGRAGMAYQTPSGILRHPPVRDRVPCSMVLRPPTHPPAFREWRRKADQ